MTHQPGHDPLGDLAAAGVAVWLDDLSRELLAGGGLPMGKVIGQSDKSAGSPATEPVRIRNLIGKVMHTLFDVGKLRLVRGLPREIIQMIDYSPIAGLSLSRSQKRQDRKGTAGGTDSPC